MGDQGQAPAMTAPFPQPPPYFKHFTKENVARLRDLEKSRSLVNGNGVPGDASLPSDDLQYLIPPEPPADEKYKSFGVQHDLNQPDISLASAGITQIYPTSPASTDPTPKLIALSRAILLNFLELVGIVSLNPEESMEKVEDLQTLFYNAHDLINQYRPHQARESLILMMEEQLGRARSEIKAVHDAKEQLGDTLRGIRDEGLKQKKALAETATETKEVEAEGDMETRERRKRQRAMWDALAAELG